MKRSTREIPPLYCSHPLFLLNLHHRFSPLYLFRSQPRATLSRSPDQQTCFVLTPASRHRFSQKRMSRGETKGELADNYRSDSRDQRGFSKKKKEKILRSSSQGLLFYVNSQKTQRLIFMRKLVFHVRSSSRGKFPRNSRLNVRVYIVGNKSVHLESK